ncbi:Glycosyl transferase, group 1 family protein [hydrothermal vent metagenome]|uniref:Glycosyl transferase, group 1 family protein n=1 Tax=hydrothermal vent metagenome TaxID=652676 RepID=A0A3B1ARV1_9ZZZZ
MRLLIISQYFWPENFRINDLAKALVERGHEVTVLTGKPNYPAGTFFSGYGFFKLREEQRNGVTIKRVPLIPRGDGSGVRLAINYLSFVLSACLLGPFRCRGNFDFVFVFEPSPFTVGIPGMLFRWLKKAPMMFWVQDLWPESLTAAGAVRNPHILRWLGHMVRIIYHRCDRVLVQSEAFMEPATAAGADPKRTYYFPNWAEKLYQPLSLPSDAVERGEIPDKFCILFAGNLGEAQSLETIVQAARKVDEHEKDISWIMIGDGRRLTWMKSEVERLGLEKQIHFLGRRPMESMPRYFALADALLVTLRPDPIFSRTIPSKVQAYLACGRPIVAALDGEGARIVRDSAAGIVVNAGDADALAKAVLALKAMSADEREQMGQHGRTYFENYFESEMLISRLEGWMEEMIEEGLCAS